MLSLQLNAKFLSLLYELVVVCNVPVVEQSHLLSDVEAGMSVVIRNVTYVLVVGLDLTEPGVQDGDIGCLKLLVIQVTKELRKTIVLSLHKELLSVTILHLAFLASRGRSIFTARLISFLLLILIHNRSYKLSGRSELVKEQILVGVGKISQAALEVRVLLQQVVTVAHELEPVWLLLVLLRLLFVNVGYEASSLAFLPLVLLKVEIGQIGGCRH